MTLSRKSEEIIGSIYLGEYGGAESSIEAARERRPAAEVRRLVELAAVLRRQTGPVRENIDQMCRAYSKAPNWLPHLSRSAEFLMDAGQWSDADVVLDELVALSEMKCDHYFLNDARMCRVVCLKHLGRDSEVKALKSEIPAGSETYIGGKIFRIDDVE